MSLVGLEIPELRLLYKLLRQIFYLRCVYDYMLKSTYEVPGTGKKKAGGALREVSTPSRHGRTGPGSVRLRLAWPIPALIWDSGG